MRPFIIAICFLVQLKYTPAFSQTDSIAVVNAAWKAEKLAPGVKLKTHHFTNGLFGANQNISVVEIKPKKRNVLDIAYSEKTLIPTDEFGKTEKALVALNGTFFDIANGGSVDYIRSDGRVINENRLSKEGARAAHQKAALVFQNGKVSIAKWDGTSDWESKLSGEDIMVSGPLLIIDDQVQMLDSNSFNNTRHPRTAVALTDKNRVLLVTVDGRSDMSAGMSLTELAKVLKWLKADDAVNLDGGGSTALWLDGKKTKGIINYPSDNKKWDHEGVRKVANVVLLRSR